MANRAPPVVAASPVRPRVRSLSQEDDSPSPPSKPQKRRRRMQRLAAAMAMDKASGQTKPEPELSRFDSIELMVSDMHQWMQFSQRQETYLQQFRGNAWQSCYEPQVDMVDCEAGTYSDTCELLLSSLDPRAEVFHPQSELRTQKMVSSSSSLSGDFRRLPEYAWARTYSSFQTAHPPVSARPQSEPEDVASSSGSQRSAAELEAEQEALAMTRSEFKRLVQVGTLAANVRFEIGYMGTCNSCNEELAASWFMPAGKDLVVCLGCRESLAGVQEAADAGENHQLKELVAVSVQLEDEVQVNASASASGAPHGWPDISQIQQQQFQEWYTSRARQRADVFEKAMTHCLDQAEAAQACGDVASSRLHTDRARKLQASGKSLGSLEDQRCEAWTYLEHVQQEAQRTRSCE